MGWTELDIADQTGTVVVVTGANSGVGLHASKALVRHGAHVVMACRDLGRAQDALAAVSTEGPGRAEIIQLDLADLESVEAFAKELADKHAVVDTLINNAGVMAGQRQSTAQGFEMQMGTNHLGHFVLTAKLWPLLIAAPAPRVISTSSLAARGGNLTPVMDEALLIDPHPYSAFNVYSNTKQATLLFAQELHRRSEDARARVSSIAIHPGISATNLFTRQMQSLGLGAFARVANGAGRVVLQSPKAAAQATVRAATDPTIASGDFVGPGSFGQSRGAPEVLRLYTVGKDPATAGRLWDLSEFITGVPFAL